MNTATQEFRDGLKQAESALDLVSASLISARNQLVGIYEELTTNMMILRNTAIALSEEERTKTEQ